MTCANDIVILFLNHNVVCSYKRGLFTPFFGAMVQQNTTLQRLVMVGVKVMIFMHYFILVCIVNRTGRI